MPNPTGTPIWYELMTSDLEASRAFYEEVLGWKVQPAPAGERDYRMIDAGNGFVGGALELDDKMRQGGARPTWLFYVGVEDVDATVAKVVAEGGRVLLEAFDLPGIGRLAMITDPQGIPLYVMRGASDESSTAFDRHGLGRCNWNELSTPNQTAAHAFYAKVFGWTFPDRMAMPNGEYVFVAVGDTTIGATMPEEAGAPPGWRFYFRARDIEEAAAKVERAGGKVHAGPMDVPGGDRVIVASDPHGVPFGVVGPAK